MRLFLAMSFATVMCLATSVPASAQWSGEAQASGGAGGGGAAAASRASSGPRLGVQVRLDAFNLFGVQDGVRVGGGASDVVPAAFVPLVTPGVRLLDSRLFIGLGFGFYSISVSECGGDGCADEEDIVSISGWSLNPLVSFDLLSDDWGALHLLGWLNFATLNSLTQERIRPGATDTTEVDGQFWWGANVGAGVRGKLGPGLAIGGELGWGFATYTDDGNRSGDADDETVFIHGIFGILLFEASVGL